MLEHLPEIAIGAVLVTTFLLLLIQEMTNGFHDTANAVAATIYSKSMAPLPAVLTAGICNAVGVIIGGTAVAFAMVHLLPTGVIDGIDNLADVLYIFGFVIAAVSWNFATWWYGIPNSTTHTYVGGLIGASLAYALAYDLPVRDAIHLGEVEGIILGLILSPLLGAAGAWILYRSLKSVAKDDGFYCSMGGESPPHKAIRGSLIAGTVGISLLHGSNDGQKSLGLFFLCAVGLVPGLVGINMEADESFKHAVMNAPATISQAETVLKDYPPLVELLQEAQVQAAEAQHVYDAGADDNTAHRKAIVGLSRTVKTILNRADVLHVPETNLSSLKELAQATQETIFFIPFWIVALSASCLGFGTVVGYKRIVRTLGERLGESPISPAHGVASQFTTVGCIGLATATGLPVSTTHVLTSGVVGALNSSHEKLKFSMISGILVTWLTTLPGSILLAFTISYLLHLSVTT